MLMLQLPRCNLCRLSRPRTHSTLSLSAADLRVLHLPTPWVGVILCLTPVSHPSLQQTRILLLEGGSLAPVRDWDDQGGWSNRVSSLTAENIDWLDSESSTPPNQPRHQRMAAHRAAPLPRGRRHYRLCKPRPREPPDAPLPAGRQAPRAHDREHQPPEGAPAGSQGQTQRHDQRGCAGERDAVRRGEGLGGAQGRRPLGARGVGCESGVLHYLLQVGADGPNSPVRAFAEIDTFGHAYNAHGVVATLTHAPSLVYPNHTAFQRFLPTGPLAFLPLSDTASTMVWSTTPQLATALKKLSPEALTLMVNAGWTLPESDLGVVNDALLASDAAGSPLTLPALSSILSSLPDLAPTEAPLPPVVTSIDPKSVASFPLRLSHADAYTAHRLALVGDAAHTTHPLAGQGLNAGLADARVLASVLAKASNVGADLGGITALAAYPRERYLPNHVMLAAVDKLNWVFGSRNPVVNWARGTGLEVFNELGPVKDFFMANAGSGASGSKSSLPSALADAAEAFQVVRGVAGAAGGMIASGLRNLSRR